MSNKELLEGLTNWFNQLNLNNKNVWHEDKVAALIKTNLNKIGHWRNRPSKKQIENFNNKLIKNKEKLKQKALDEWLNS